MTATVLLIGASRGLGHALAREFLVRGWRVIASVRQQGALSDLSAQFGQRLQHVLLDINRPADIEALYNQLPPASLDMLFVNAGVASLNGSQTIGEVDDAEFMRLMTTNALSPMRVIERLAPCVKPDGLIGVMSSGRGSLTNNVHGQEELYRGSKALLNMFMRSYAARQNISHPHRSLILMAPGWVRTDLGGEQATLTIEESIPKVAQLLIDYQQHPGLHYLDYLGRTVPW